MTNSLIRLAFLAGFCVFSYQTAAVAQPFCPVPPFAEWPSSPIALGVNVHQVVAVQADQDGLPDLAWVEADREPLEGAPTALWLALSNGNGGFRAPVKVGSLQVYAANALVGDLNADGHEDILIFPYSGSTVQTALGDGAGGLSISDGFNLGSAARPSLANLNGDEFPDLILPGLFSSQIFPYLGNGDGTFQPLNPVSAGFRPRSVAVADVNGDGIDDAAVPQGPFLQLLYSDLGEPLERSIYVPTALEDTTDVYLSEIVAGSFNGDEYLDFAALSVGHLHVWTSDGAGQLAAALYPITGVNASAFRGADLNGDGLTDLLWMDADTKQWFVMPANSDGSFDGTLSPITPPNQDRSIQARDVDGDGQVDVIGAVFGSDQARIFRNTCPFLLTTAVTPDPGFSGEAIEYRFGVRNGSDQSTGDLQWALTSPQEINPLSANPSAGLCATPTNCDLGALNPDESVEVTVDASLAAGYIGNTGPTATVSEASIGAYSWKAAHWAAPRVVPQLSLTVTPGVVAPPLTTTARVSIRNDGSDVARNAIVRLSAPAANVEFLGSILGPACAPGNPGEIACALGDIAPGTDSRSIEIELRAIAASASPVVIRADFTSDEGFTDTAQAPLQIIEAPDPDSLSLLWRRSATDPLQGAAAPFAVPPPADWNGDGNLDLIIGQARLLGTGDGGFTPAPEPDPPILHSILTLSQLADFDGDGVLDLAEPRTVRKGDGSGYFAEVLDHYDNTHEVFYQGLVVADFNEDGRPDIAAGTNFEVQLYLGDGDGTFTKGALLNGSLAGSVSGDFNGDGHQDLITFAPDAMQPAVIHLGDGAGGFASQPTSVEEDLWPASSAIADFDDDGLLDLALLLQLPGGTQLRSLRIFFGDGAGDFGPAVHAAASIKGGPVQPHLPVGDWDLDGRPEIAVAYPTIVDFIAGRQTRSTSLNLPSFMTPLLIADVNNDGAPDLIGEWETPPLGSSSLAVLLNKSVPATKLGVFVDGHWFLDRNGDYNFDPATEVHGWGSPGDVPVRGDWDGDGDLDLGVFHDGQWFLDRNGDHAFDPATEAIGWGLPGWTPAPGDWNGDGITDLGIVSPDSTWFRDLDGDRMFDPVTEILGWGSPGDVPVVGDWNGDGKDDVGVFSNGVWFLDRDGDNQFTPATEIIGWGEAGWTPAVGDWNGDGATDLGVVAPDSIWFRDLNGDYMFDPATEVLGWGNAGATPTVGDWNGDGKDDLGVFLDGVWTLFGVGDRYWGEAGWTPVQGVWR